MLAGGSSASMLKAGGATSSDGTSDANVRADDGNTRGIIVILPLSPIAHLPFLADGTPLLYPSMLHT